MLLQSVKHNTRSKAVTNLSISLEDLLKLFEIIKDLNDEAKELQSISIYEFWESVNKSFKQEDIDEIVKKSQEKYIVGIDLFDQKGELWRTYDPDEAFDKKKFPDNIASIRLSNIFLFDSQQELVQTYRITLFLDFRKPTAIDLSSNPSNPTSNTSYVEVIGVKSSWTEGAFSKIDSFLKQRKSRRSWLHTKNVYAFYAWLFFIPVVLWNLFKIENYIRINTPDISNILLFIIFIYTFFVALIIIGLTFNSLRNLFPPVEIIDVQTGFRKTIRNLLIGVTSIIILEQMGELIWKLIKILF